ncbi:MAG: TetR family transcriptional regulator [Candidatus Nanopelagicales bacterium]
MATDDVRDAVLDAARAAFHARGYAKTSVKAVAAAAGVAPEVVSRYYQSKDKLFAAALRLPFDPGTAIPQLVAPGLEGMGERLTRVTLETLGDPESRDDLIALARAGSSTGRAVAGMKSLVEQDIVDRLAVIIGVPDARLRANLITSYLMGVAINRYVLRLDPLASMSDEDVIRLVSPTIQDWLTPTKPLPKYKSEPNPASRKPRPTREPDPFDAVTDWPGA